jgi:ubiquinone/menaquinone biosynthesis C-methylase UbiE
MRLDVGCGNRPTGDINVDLFMNEETRHVDLNKCLLVDAKKIPNPIKADANHLPFKDGTFEEVYCAHVLEHLENPTKGLLELIRVSKDKVVVILPHRYHFAHKTAVKIGVHKHTFSATSVIEWLKKLELPCLYSVTTIYKPKFFSTIIPLIQFPYEICIEIKKAWK